MIEMLSVLAIIGVLSVSVLMDFTFAMNRHRANETIQDIMLRGTNVPMVDDNYASKPSGHEFTFPDLPAGTYYPMTTKKDAGSSYYVEATGVTSRVCEMILKMNPPDIGRIMVGDAAYAGDASICGDTDGLRLRFCFGEDGSICNGSGYVSGDPCADVNCGAHESCRNGQCVCEAGYYYYESAGLCCEELPSVGMCQYLRNPDYECPEVWGVEDGSPCTTNDQEGYCKGMECLVCAADEYFDILCGCCPNIEEVDDTCYEWYYDDCCPAVRPVSNNSVTCVRDGQEGLCEDGVCEPCPEGTELYDYHCCPLLEEPDACHEWYYGNSCPEIWTRPNGSLCMSSSNEGVCQDGICEPCPEGTRFHAGNCCFVPDTFEGYCGVVDNSGSSCPYYVNEGSPCSTGDYYGGLYCYGDDCDGVCEQGKCAAQ